MNLFRLLPAVSVAGLLLLGGCGDTAFDPFEEGTLNFSVFGFLDAGADTQFVRISTLRDSVALSPGPIDAEVVLQETATGHTIGLRDSLFVFFQEGQDRRIAYNFWTPEPLEPGATYRLTVTRSDGAATRAEVTLPGALPDPVLFAEGTFLIPVRDWVQTITVKAVERLADVVVVLRFRDNDTPGQPLRMLRMSYVERLRSIASGVSVTTDIYADLRHRLGTTGCPVVVEATAVIAVAGPDWPDLTGIDDETLALPGVVTNIEEGVGFLGGIASRTLPWPELVGLMGAKQRDCAGL